MLERSKQICFTALLAGVMLATQAGAPSMAQAPERIDVLIGFDRAPGAAERAVVTGLGGRIKYSYTIVDAVAANIPAAAVSALLRNPRVVAVELDGTVHAIDAELDAAWGVKHIGAGTVHGGGNTGSGVKIAIIDTGIDYTHPDLNAVYAGGWNFVNNDNDPMDDHYHGTHVAGTACAEDDGAGVVGAAPVCALYALKVLNESGSGYWSDIIAAVEWAVNNGVQVTNNSYGSGSDPGSIVKQAFDNSYAAGVLHIAAAGNSGNPKGKGDKVGYPARYASVVAVAATDSNDNRAWFSSTGPDVELAAPGVSILSTMPNNGYGSLSGTSMASPHVAGTAALVIAAGYSGPDAVRTRLQETADDLGDAGRDNLYGYGLVDADEAAVSPSGDLPPAVSIMSPGDGDPVSGMVAITAEASDDNSVTQVEFFIDGSSIFVDTASPWSADWDSKTAADTDHTITATAKDDAGQTTPDSITVSVDNGGGGDAPPTVTVTNPGDKTTVSGTVEVTADASDDGGVKQVEFFVDGTSIFVDTASPWAVDWDSTTVADTDHTITATAKDDAGQTTSDSINVTVDNGGGGGGDMYVSAIDWGQKDFGPRGSFHDLITTVTIGSVDGAVSSATVLMTLCWVGFDNDCWNFGGDTDGSGQVKFTLKHAPDGDYEAQVTGVTHATYTYNAGLDTDNPATTAFPLP